MSEDVTPEVIATRRTETVTEGGAEAGSEEEIELEGPERGTSGEEEETQPTVYSISSILSHSLQFACSRSSPSH